MLELAEFHSSAIETTVTPRPAEPQNAGTSTSECEVCYDNIDEAGKQLLEFCPHMQMCLNCFQRWLCEETSSVTKTNLRCPAYSRCETQPSDKHHFSPEQVMAAAVSL